MVTTFVLPFAHYDNGYCAAPSECAEHFSSLLEHALTSLELDSSLRFCVETVFPLTRFWATRPARRDQLRAAVLRGQLEVGALYFAVIPQAAGSSGQRWNLELARDWCVTHLGLTPTVAMLTDIAGHDAELPTLLAAFGVRGAFCSRRSYGLEAWRWRASNGDSVLAVDLHRGRYRSIAEPGPYGYEWAREAISRGQSVTARAGDRSNPLPILIPFGDNLTAVDFDAVRSLGVPCTPSEYLAQLPGDLPERHGSLPFEYVDAATVEPMLWRELRAARGACRAADAFATLAARLIPGRVRGVDIVGRRARVLAAAEHNFGGRRAEETEEVRVEHARSARIEAREEARSHIASIGARIAGAETSWVVANPLAWRRRAVVHDYLETADREASTCALRGSDGKPIPMAVVAIETSSFRRRFHFIASVDLPPLGYRAFRADFARERGGAEAEPSLSPPTLSIRLVKRQGNDLRSTPVDDGEVMPAGPWATVNLAPLGVGFVREDRLAGFSAELRVECVPGDGLTDIRVKLTGLVPSDSQVALEIGEALATGHRVGFAMSEDDLPPDTRVLSPDYVALATPAGELLLTGNIPAAEVVTGGLRVPLAWSAASHGCELFHYNPCDVVIELRLMRFASPRTPAHRRRLALEHETPLGTWDFLTRPPLAPVADARLPRSFQGADEDADNLVVEAVEPRGDGVRAFTMRPSADATHLAALDYILREAQA